MTQTATRTLSRPAVTVILDRVRPLLPRMFRFAATGILAGAVQLALLHLWLAWGWHALLANTVAYLLSAQVNFLLSETFIWGDRRTEMHPVQTLMRRWVAFHGSLLGTALLNQAVFAVAQTAFPPLVAAALGIIAGGLINFLVQDRFVFGERQEP